MKQQISTDVLPDSMKKEPGKESTDATDFLKEIGLTINQQNKSTVEVTFPLGWEKEILTGERYGWSMYTHKESGKHFHTFKHPYSEGIFYICIINCIEEEDPRKTKKPN